MSIDDDAFLAAFLAGHKPDGVFRHVDHVRIVWIFLRRDGPALAEERMVNGIRRFAEAQGMPALYHETLTRAWVRLVAAARAESAPASFAQFLAVHPELSDKTLVFRHYSPAALSAPAARGGWVEPDLRPLPPCACGSREKRATLLRAAFLLGAVTDGLAVVPMVVPAAASLLWGFDAETGPYRFAMGYAASLMAAWTGLLLWAYGRPIERAFVAALTVLVIYGLIATEVIAVMNGHMSAWRMMPTWILQTGLLGLFAAAYHDHYPRLVAGRRADPRGAR